MTAQPAARAWSGGFAWRIALVVLAALAAVLGATYVVDTFGRGREATRQFAVEQGRQIAAAVALLDAAPPGGDAAIVAALNGPGLMLRIAAAPPDWQGSRRPYAARAAALLRDALGPVSGRAESVRLLSRGDDAPTASFPPLRSRIGVAITAGPARWYIFVAELDPSPPRWGMRMTGWLVAIGLAVALAAVWASHRVTRPLRRFADAAERLGVDVMGPPLPEDGSRELRQATRAMNRMQARIRRLVDDRTRMLAAISHDLRTALTRLRLRAEYIEDAEQQKKAFDDLDDMRTMLDATLAFARDDARAEPRARIDLASLLESLCDDHADAGRPARYAGPARAALAARPVALRRAFANLIDNALRYGEAADVTLSETAELLIVEIADRGPGIAPELREKVFEPFFRIEGSRSRDTGGTGLGLAVARSIVRGHGGDITLDDRPGGGLVVRVELPRAAA